MMLNLNHIMDRLPAKNFRAIIIAIILTVGLIGCGSEEDDSSVGKTCGGLLGLQCEPNSFCNFSSGLCGADDRTGVCEIKPETCIEIFAPVCGCDDNTYSNGCFAALAGISVLHEGNCDN